MSDAGAILGMAVGQEAKRDARQEQRDREMATHLNAIEALVAEMRRVLDEGKP